MNPKASKFQFPGERVSSSVHMTWWLGRIQNPNPDVGDPPDQAQAWAGAADGAYI